MAAPTAPVSGTRNLRGYTGGSDPLLPTAKTSTQVIRELEYGYTRAKRFKLSDEIVKRQVGFITPQLDRITSLPAEIQARIFEELMLADHICLALTCKHMARISALVDLSYGFIYERQWGPAWFNCVDVEDRSDYRCFKRYETKPNPKLNSLDNRHHAAPDIRQRSVQELKLRLREWMPQDLVLCEECGVFRSKKKSNWSKTARCSQQKINKWLKGELDDCPLCIERLAKNKEEWKRRYG